MERDNNPVKWQNCHPRHVLRYPELFSGVPTSLMLFLCISVCLFGLGGVVAYIKALDYAILTPGSAGHKPRGALQLKAAVKSLHRDCFPCCRQQSY